jgi:RNA polymerase sigma-70 factor (ECF subfamily)
VDSSETAASITPPDEQKLVEQLRAGDEAAFEQLVRLHGGRLLAVAQRYLRNEDDARDAVQDAFLGAFRSIDRFREGARISTWLHRIVVNAALMKLRSRRRKPEESIDDLLPSFLPDGHQEQPAVRWREMPDAALERGEIRQRVRDAIDQLPDSYRIVLLLRDIEELDTEETAAALEMSANAVKTRLHRARQALRTLLDPQLRERPA